MAFIQRLMSAKFQLGTNRDGSPQKPFADTGADVMTVSGLRMSATINKAGTPFGATLQMSIYGMTISQMNQLATLGMVYAQIKRNKITVLAGDSRGPLATAFVGTILQAWIDFSSQPNVAFRIEAQTLGAESVISADPTSIKQGVDVAETMKGFATKMGLAFENNGITAKLPPSYFYGAIAGQAAACAAAAGINWFVDNGILAIWPKGKSRLGTVPLISKDTGLIGFPGFTAYGIALKTVYNPDIRFAGQIKVVSDLEPVNAVGTWTIYFMDHHLESMMPRGKWHSDLVCFNPDFPRQVADR